MPGAHDTNYPCQSCDYDLSGLDAMGACPECGRPVWSSKPEPYADEAAVGVARAARFFACCSVLLSWTVVGGAVFGGVALGMARASRRRARLLGAAPSLMIQQAWWLSVVGLGLSAVGLVVMVTMFWWLF